jgi:hypothetical protein
VIRPVRLSYLADLRMRVTGRKGRHRGKAKQERPTAWQGATLDWSPKDDILTVKPAREPEETPAEAAEREAAELSRHRAEIEQAAEVEVCSEWADHLDPILDPLFAAVDEACRAVLEELGLTPAEADELFAKARQVATPTGEYPVVARELVAA